MQPNHCRRSLEFQQTVEMIWVEKQESFKCNLTLTHTRARTYTFQSAIRGVLEGFFLNCETSNFTAVRRGECVCVTPKHLGLHFPAAVNHTAVWRPTRSHRHPHAGFDDISRGHRNTFTTKSIAMQRSSRPARPAMQDSKQHLHNTDSNFNKVSCHPKSRGHHDWSVHVFDSVSTEMVWNGISMRRYLTGLFLFPWWPTASSTSLLIYLIMAAENVASPS